MIFSVLYNISKDKEINLRGLEQTKIPNVALKHIINKNNLNILWIAQEII